MFLKVGEKMKVGIPRGLLFYRFYALWKTFLEELGAEVVISPPTNKGIIQKGLTYAVEEICFPAKVFLGHVLYLKDRVDLIFIPRIVSFHRREYNCPKILALPDLARNLFNIPEERIIGDEINMREEGMRGWRRGFLNIGKHFTTKESKIMKALNLAEKAHKDYQANLKKGMLPEDLIDHKNPLPLREKKIVLLGHTYLLSDSYINMNITEKVNDLNYSVITPDMVDEEKKRYYLSTIPKPSFWTISNEIIGSTLYHLKERKPEVRGFIHLVSFECGPDSLVGELIERLLKREKESLPYLRLEIDEHTGEAGLVTRLEAFVDMMEWRYKSLESYVSPFASS
ncbi:MAG: acyl-CoA dehydratase activase-related protein [Atribacterales bacterium]|jgi:predicted nucleotide-binding protein (sugar kinase/HSP70/actin superfamily)